MKKRIITLLAITAILTLSSCQRFFQRVSRNFQNSARDYRVYMYSGDSLVFYDSFHGIINQEEHSDGIFYFKGDTLIELSGNYIIKSEK